MHKCAFIGESILCLAFETCGVVGKPAEDTNSALIHCRKILLETEVKSSEFSIVLIEEKFWDNFPVLDKNKFTDSLKPLFVPAHFKTRETREGKS